MREVHVRQFSVLTEPLPYLVRLVASHLLGYEPHPGRDDTCQLTRGIRLMPVEHEIEPVIGERGSSQMRV